MPDRLQSLVGRVLGISPEKVSDTTSMQNCPKWDSLQHFTLVLAIEEEFGVQFSSTRIPELTRVSVIREELARLKGEK